MVITLAGESAAGIHFTLRRIQTAAIRDHLLCAAVCGPCLWSRRQGDPLDDHNLKPNECAASAVLGLDFAGGALSMELQVEAEVFGSVALEAYLPDGDIDFCLRQVEGPPLQAEWRARLYDALVAETQQPSDPAFLITNPEEVHAKVRLFSLRLSTSQDGNCRQRRLVVPQPLSYGAALPEDASSVESNHECLAAMRKWNGTLTALERFRAQVQVIKFLVNDVMIDVTFGTVGGICAVHFLRDMDVHINKGSLFRRSIILVK